MEDDYSDILGSGVLNVKPKSGLPFGVKATILICVLIPLYIVGATVWQRFLRWRELSYRLAMRRRHGIPDDDHRPFNVAYAAVQRAREQREALRRAKSRPMSNTAREQPASATQHKQDLRQRTGPARNLEATGMKDRVESLPGGYRHNITAGPSKHNPVNNGQQPILQNEEKVLYPRATELVTSNHPTAASSRISKIPSDNRRLNYTYMDVDQGSIVANRLRSSDTELLERATFKRGSKREYGDAEETEDVLESKRAREKRARKISLEKAILHEDMEVDENELEDENTDHGQVSRGKKRDREEAGSTFGGDDEHWSELEAGDDAMTRRPSRKRRSVNKRKSDLAAITRGKKRDRDIDEETSDEGSDRDYTQASARKRRNKKAEFPDEEDVSMEESPAKGKGRKIGEEWTSNGVFYKIGPNGQRLRQALVKKARQKYHMPQDSQHPDRDANLEVYVETWLTEEDYQDAKARHSLAWQDSPKASVERDTHEAKVTQPPPSPVGKSLLWKTAATPPATMLEAGSPISEYSGAAYPTTKGRISYDPRRQSITVDVATRINPFYQQTAQSSKRIASGNTRVSSAGLVDSTNSSPRTGHRIYSKWEKQDLEANAMMKMREVARKKENEERERQEKERQEKERAEREKAEKDRAAIPSVPIITITKPAEDKPTGTGMPNPFATPVVPAKDAVKSPVAASSPVSLSGFPKSGEKTTTESKAPSFPSATPAATPFTFAVPGSSPFASLPKPAVDDAKPGDQPKPTPFAPQPSGLTSASSTSPATATPSFFSFPKPSAVLDPKKPEQNGQASSPSLLSRLGNVVPDATPASSSQPSTISFPKPTEAPKSFFTAMPTTAQPTSTTSTLSNAAPASSVLKFDFKLSNKPSSTTATASATTAPDVLKPGSGTNPFSHQPVTAPSAETNAGTSGATPFKFTFSDPNLLTAMDAKEDKGTQGSKQTLTFTGFSKSTSAFPNTGVAGDKTSQPGFGILSNPNDKSGPPPFAGFNPNPNTLPSSGSMAGDASKMMGFSTLGNVQVPNSTSVPETSKQPSFGERSAFGTFAASNALGGISSFAMPKLTGTNSTVTFGKTPSAPAATPAATTSEASAMPKQPSSFTLNDTSKVQGSSNAPPTTTSFAVNRTPLNHASTAKSAATAFSSSPNPFQTASGSRDSTTNSAINIFGSQPASNSTSSSLSGALGGSGQSVSNPTTSSASSGANVAFPLGAPSSQFVFGSTSNTPNTFAVPGVQSAFPTANTSQPSLGAPSTQSAPSLAFGGPSVFGSTMYTKPGTALFGAPGGTPSTFGNSNSTPQNSASAQTSMSSANNTGGQS